MNAADNCVTVANPGQQHNDGDASGDACDPDDDDDDKIDDTKDNCQLTANPNQQDDDGDAKGDACDAVSDSNACTASGHGSLLESAKQVSFSLGAKGAQRALKGHCTVTAGKTKLECLNIEGYRQPTTDDRVVIVGRASVDGVRTRYRIVLEEPGASATAGRFTISTDSGFSAGGGLVEGSIRIRRASRDHELRSRGASRRPIAAGWL